VQRAGTISRFVTGSFRYPARVLGLDYAGSTAGIALSLGLIVFVRLAAPVAWVATAAAALFLVYFGRTVCRQLTHIELDETGIRVKGPAVGLLSAAIRWADLCSLRLDYYSTRRDGEGGWMQLRLGDERHTIRIDSELDGFAELAGAAARAAARRDIVLDATTAANLKALLP
jgi:hypothetical protein